MAETIRVSVVCAWPDRAFVRDVVLAAGSTVADAVEACGLYREHPDARQPESRYGVYSRRVDAQAVLRDGDRVEVYRPLLVDPKQARRRRAQRSPE